VAERRPSRRGRLLSAAVSKLERTGERYATHHREHRSAGDFVFVPERLPLFARLVGGPGLRVLDLGCRSGVVTGHYASGNEVVGMDVDPVALERAAEQGIQAVLGDVEEPLPFPDASFDVVVAGELIEHVRDAGAFAAELVRVLRPGGRLVGSTPNSYRLQGRLRFLRGRHPDGDPTHLHFFSPAELRQILSGFQRLELHYVGGRFSALHPRLLARDVVFTGLRP
jgi:SAM-dependent methyltransferase